MAANLVVRPTVREDGQLRPRQPRREIDNGTAAGIDGTTALV